MIPKDLRILTFANSELLKIASVHSTYGLRVFKLSFLGDQMELDYFFVSQDIKNIKNTRRKEIPNEMCFCTITISLILQKPTHINTINEGPRPKPHMKTYLYMTHSYFLR